MTQPKVELKNLKTAGGEETLRFEASLYINDKKVATVSNGGTGGGHSYYFNDAEARSVFNAYVKSFHTATLDPKQPLHAFLLDFIATMQENFPWSQADIDNDMLIDGFIRVIEARKWAKKQCRKKTLYRLPTDSKDSWRSIPVFFESKIKALLHEKYGSDLYILNEHLD